MLLLAELLLLLLTGADIVAGRSALAAARASCCWSGTAAYLADTLAAAVDVAGGVAVAAPSRAAVASARATTSACMDAATEAAFFLPSRPPSFVFAVFSSERGHLLACMRTRGALVQEKLMRLSPPHVSKTSRI